MPTDADVPSAGWRVAEHARPLPRSVVHASVPVADLRALLPVLDAVGAGADADRVERWARTLDPALWAKVDGESSVLDPATIEYGRIASLDRARAAIALADAERAAAPSGPIPPAALALAVETWGEAWTANEAGSLAEFGRVFAAGDGTPPAPER